MKLSIITDEFTQELDTAIVFAKEYGLEGLELRTIEDLPLEKHSPAHLQEMAARIREADLTVPDIAGSFYKCSYADRAGEMDKLQKLIRAAVIFQAPYIRCFGFLAEGAPDLETIAEAFDEPLRMAKAAGKTLLLEADPSVTTSNHRLLSELITAIRARAKVTRIFGNEEPPIGAIFDPGNDLYDPLVETPYPDGYRVIQPYIRHIHIKDAIRDESGPHCVKVGEGSVGFDRLLNAVYDSGYTGYLSLECHYRSGIELTEEQMKLPGGADFSAGGLSACMESTLALKALLESVAI